MDRKSIIKILKQYTSLLIKEGIEIENAFLYGSYANATYTEDSDIDILIVSKQFDKENDYLAGKIWALTRKVNTKIEPYIIGLNKFLKNETSPLIYSVKKEGYKII